MAELEPMVEQQLADMSDEDFRALTARVRPPRSRGEAGLAEAARRFGNTPPKTHTAAATDIQTGRPVQTPGDAQAQLTKRFGKRDHQ